MLHEKELTELIIRLFYRVYDRLGFGFLESVYQECLEIELRLQGIRTFRKSRFRLNTRSSRCFPSMHRTSFALIR